MSIPILREIYITVLSLFFLLMMWAFMAVIGVKRHFVPYIYDVPLEVQLLIRMSKTEHMANGYLAHFCAVNHLRLWTRSPNGIIR